MRQTGSIVAPLLWITLAVLAGAFAIWPFLQDGTSDVPEAALLLDAEAVLRSDGTEFAFSVRQPSRVKIWVHLPMMLDGTVRVGPAESAGPRDIAYVPRRSDETRFQAMGRMDGPLELTLMAVGPYFVRIEPIPVAMGDADVKVRTIVRAEPIE